MTNSQLKTIDPKAFSLIELIVTISLLIFIFSASIGSYFLYYRNSLVNIEVDNVLTLIKNTRFQSLKNATSSDFGIYIDQTTNSVSSFKDSYTPGNPENVIINLEKLNITNLNLNPNVGITNSILFLKHTGKTVNTGNFIIGNNSTHFIININDQGVVDLTQ